MQVGPDVNVFLWEYSNMYKRLKLARLLGKLGVSLTWLARETSSYTKRPPVHETMVSVQSSSGKMYVVGKRP